VEAEGMRGLYRGLGPALASIMPVAGVDLAVFNTLKERYIAWERENRRNSNPLDSAEKPNGVSSEQPVQLPVSVSLGIGATAALSGGLLGYPLTVVRTRLITQHMASGVRGHQQFCYNGAVDALFQIWQHEGLRGLYRGQVPSLMKSLPAISIGYVTFEQTRGILDSVQE
jgi:solute carrier family 25 phosphate transporter 23/24/25/41